jgi:hypothetical protein
MKPFRTRSAWKRIVALRLASAGLMAEESGSPISQRLQAESDALVSSDIVLTQSSAEYGWKRGRTEWSAGLTLATQDLEYRPASFDFLGSEATVSERRILGQVSGKQRVAETLVLLGSFRAYDGFADYRSAWLNRYFSQQFTGLGYRDPEPSGQAGQAGFRWEVVPATTFLQADVSYARDRIAPGYEIDFDGLRQGRERLGTGSYHVSLETLAGRRVRLLGEVRATDTSDREPRYSAQGSVNVALGERWVARAFGGHATERPTFNASYAGASVEYETEGGWAFGLTGRWYTDTGEIENTLFTTAAPSLQAWQGSVTIRKTHGAHSVALGAGPYFTEYGAAGIGTAFFGNLYRGRTWVSARLSYSFEF